MPKVNILSTKVTLAVDVKAGDILGWDGNLATTVSEVTTAKQIEILIK